MSKKFPRRQEQGRIICASCEDALVRLPSESVDLLCTDPPYALVSGGHKPGKEASGGFMGRNWDKALPSVEVWKECLRVMKPGAFAFVMCIPRADCLWRMIARLEEAGFIVMFTPIFWAYASGFPKAQNIGKVLDKRAGIEREVTGKDKTRSMQDSIPFAERGEFDRHDKPATPNAIRLNGSYGGFQPKPAVEVVIVAMKPLSEKTFVDQALKNGKGVTWLGDGRIPAEKQVGWYDHEGFKHTFGLGAGAPRPQQERFPANLLVSDDMLNDGRIQKSGIDIRHKSGGKNFGGGEKPLMSDLGYGDSGSFSRYFDLDKWFAERIQPSGKTFPFLIVPKAANKEKWFYCRKCKKVVHAPRREEHERHAHFCKDCRVHFSSRSGKHAACETRSNFVYHPTVKPFKLMCYLLTIGSREGDLVLDPYAGTCKTAMAAKILKRGYVMIERNKIFARMGKHAVKMVRLGK